MAWFKPLRNPGSLSGSIREAYVDDTGEYGPQLVLIGRWDGERADRFSISMKVGDELLAAGFLGDNGDGTYSVDTSRRVEITRSGSGRDTLWTVQEADGAAPPQRQQPGNRPQQPSRQQNALPPASRPQQQQEAPEVTRRRVVATMKQCLIDAIAIWNDDAVSFEGSAEAVQATAATIFIELRTRNVPLAADPASPPPITDVQKNLLKQLRVAAEKVGLDAKWFNSEVAKFGPPAALNIQQAQAAADAIAKRVTDEEQKAVSDPPPPVIGGDEEIPF